MENNSLKFNSYSIGKWDGWGAYVKPLTLHEQFDNSWGLMVLFPLTLHIWVNFLQGKRSHTPSSQWSMCLANFGRQQWVGSSQWSPWLKHPLCFSQISLQSEFTAYKLSGWRTESPGSESHSEPEAAACDFHVLLYKLSLQLRDEETNSALSKAYHQVGRNFKIWLLN